MTERHERHAVYSVGSSGLSHGALATFVRTTGASLADIRLRPTGGRAQWHKSDLERTFGRKYQWVPELADVNDFPGGAPILKDPDAGFELLRMLLQTGPVVVLCVEAAPESCHRRIVTNALAEEGYPVHHLDARLEVLPPEMQPSLL